MIILRCRPVNGSSYPFKLEGSFEIWEGLDKNLGSFKIWIGFGLKLQNPVLPNPF